MLRDGDYRGDHMNLFQRYLAEEFAEDYEEGRISRRDALKLIVSVTGSLIVSNSILASCAPPPESVATGVPTDMLPATDSPTAGPTASDSRTADSAPTYSPSPAPT